MPSLLERLAASAPIVLAPTGMVPRKAMTPHVPVTAHEIAQDVASAAAIGISSVHLHARDAQGDPAWERNIYAEIIGSVRDLTPDIVINVSTSGRSWSELEKRADVLALDGDLKPDMASLTLSSLNFLSGPSVNAPDVNTIGTTNASRILKKLIDSGTTPGVYYVWANILDSPEIEPIVLQGPITVV